MIWMLACLPVLPVEEAKLLQDTLPTESEHTGRIEGFVFYNDLRQFGHFAWRDDWAGEEGVQCSFHLHDCTSNYLGAWGIQAEAYRAGRTIATDRVKSSGHFQLQVPENDAYAIRFLLRYCPGDICFSFQTEKKVLYQLWHPHATLENPIHLGQGGRQLPAVLFQPAGVEDGQADNHAHSANHFASLMELFYIWHGSTSVPFQADSFGELRITLPTQLETSGRTRGPSDIQIPESGGWIKGNKIMHEYGHVINLRAWDGQYWFDGDPSPQWSAVAIQESHIAFKEGFANFVARTSSSNIRCEGSFDDNSDGSFVPLGTWEDGILYPRNVTKFLCDWYDRSNDDDPLLIGYGDTMGEARPAKMFAILENTLLYAKMQGDRELSICSFVDAGLELYAESATDDELERYWQKLAAIGYNNNIHCGW